MAIPINGRQVGFVPDVGLLRRVLIMAGESIAALATSELTECPLWVISGQNDYFAACLLYP
jgi:hypothetical protein